MEQMSHRQFQLLLWDNAFRSGIPVSDIFELTPLCNLDCRMCYVHLQDPSLKERILRAGQWISIIDQAVSLGMISVILTGGEAMTHPDFRKIYLHLAECGISTSVKSNGILLNEDNREFFRKYPPSTIDISIYGCDRESYKAVTGHDLFDTVERNIRAAAADGLPLRFMITPSGYMGNRVEDIMRYAGSFNVKTVVNTQLFDPYEGTDRYKEDFDLSAERIMEIKRKAKELFPPAQLSFEEEEKPADSRPKEKGNGLRCIAGRSHFAVTWDGMMIPCITFPRKAISCDILENGVENAWKFVHEAVENYRIPDECMACSYHNACNYCPSSHGAYAVRRQCSPMVCALQKALIDDMK